MLSQIAGNKDRISFPAQGRTYVYALRHKTHPGRIDIDSAVSFYDLGIPGHNRHACFRSSLGHGGRNPFKLPALRSLFNNESAGQVFGLCAAHQQIVHRSAYGKLADIPSREKNGVHNKAVGRYRNSPASRNHGGIFHSGEHFIIEIPGKYFRNQLRGCPSPASMRHCYLHFLTSGVSQAFP